MKTLESALPAPPNHEEALFALALEKPAAQRPAFLDALCAGSLRSVQTSVNPKQALRRWTNARRRAVPTLPRRR